MNAVGDLCPCSGDAYHHGCCFVFSPCTLHTCIVSYLYFIVFVSRLPFFFFFFFQAEDGIRDWSVTGVQTCALPISAVRSPGRSDRGPDTGLTRPPIPQRNGAVQRHVLDAAADRPALLRIISLAEQIGRASCRERV